MKERLEAVFNQVDVAAFGYHFIGDFAIQDFFENRFPVHGSKSQIFQFAQSHQVMEVQHGETDKELDSFPFPTDNHPVLYIQLFFKCKGTVCKFIHNHSPFFEQKKSRPAGAERLWHFLSAIVH